MQAVVTIHFAAMLFLMLSLFAFLKIKFPDSSLGKVLAIIC